MKVLFKDKPFVRYETSIHKPKAHSISSEFCQLKFQVSKINKTHMNNFNEGAAQPALHLKSVA